MGYTIIIGERVPGRGQRRPTAASVELPDAPAFGEPTDRTNERWPSYSGWADFLQAVGLTYLSPRTSNFAVDPSCPPLMVDHPGVMPVKRIHLERVEAAYAAYRAKLGPDVKPGWGHGPDDSDTDGPAPGYDGHLARLEWLRFWLRWALENCKKPVCANS